MGALPARKTLASSRPPTAAELNYNFLALWNLLTGNVDAVNAPSLLSKITGGDIQAALRIINNGLVIGSAFSPAGVAGRFLLDHPTGLIELTTQGGAGTGELRFGQTAGTAVWSLVFDTASGILLLSKSGAGATFGIGAPKVLTGAGQVKKTETHYIGAIAFGADAQRIIRIPNDAKRTGGEFKIRLIVNPDGIDAAAASHYHYNWRKSADPYAFLGAVNFANFVSAANVLHTSEWLTIGTQPVAADQFLLLQIHNGCGAVNYGDATVELQYVVDREGLNADAV